MLSFQLKQSKKSKYSALNSPRTTRSRSAVATTNDLRMSEGGTAGSKDLIATIPSLNKDNSTCSEKPAETPDTDQVRNMSSLEPTPPPDLTVKPSIEQMIMNLTTQFATFDVSIKRMDSNINATRAEMCSNQTAITAQLKDVFDQNKVLEEKLSTANERIITLENLYFDLYHKQERDLMNKQAMNLIIRGIPELPNEKMHEIMGELLDTVGSFAYVATNGATRLGNRNKSRANDPTATPRPIRLRCATVLQKGEIFRAIDKLKKVQKFKDIRVANELNKDDMLEHKEVQMLYAEASSLPNTQTRMRGNKIEIDGRTYDRGHFDNLPKGITRSTASTVICDDAMAFRATVLFTATWGYAVSQMIYMIMFV